MPKDSGGHTLKQLATDGIRLAGYLTARVRTALTQGADGDAVGS